MTHTDQMSPELQALLDGPKRHVSHANEELLHDPARGFIVASGAMEVFAYISVNDATQRIHLASLKPGDMAFGLSTLDGVVRIQAIASETEVVDLDVAALAANETVKVAIAPSVDRWVTALTASVSKRGKPSGQYVSAAEPISSLEEETYASSTHVAWVRSPSSDSLWYMGELPVPANQAVAVNVNAWVEAHATCEATSFQTTSPEFNLVEALGSQHDFIVRLLAEQAAHERQDELARIKRREVNDEETLASATAKLAAAVRQDKAVLTAQNDIPLVAAAQIAGEACGIQIKAPKDGEAALEQSDDPFQMIATASLCEFRTIVLEGAWWDMDGEPLLAFLDDGLVPVALVPRTFGKGVDMINPATGLRTEVTPEIAGTLFSVAVIFYPSLPEEPSTLGKLFKISSKGIANDIYIALSMLILVGIASTVTPMVVGEITGAVVQEAQRDRLGLLIAAIVLAAMASVSFTFVQSVAALRVEGRLDLRAQAAVWIRLLNLPASFFRQYTIGDLTARALGIDAMRRMITTSALSSLMSFTTGVFSLGLMFYYSPLLAACASGGLIVYGITMIVFARRAIRHQELVLAEQGRIQSMTLQLIQAISKLRVTGAEARAFDRWSNAYMNTRKRALDWQRNGAAVPIANAFFNFVGLTIFIAVIALQAGQFWGPDEAAFSWKAIDNATLSHVISSPEFLAFFTAYGQLYAAVTSIIQVVMTLVGFYPLRDRLTPILETRPESTDDGEDPGALTGAIEVNNVEFRYVPDMPLVLKGLSLSIEPGSFVAFVGPSGAGKSSLIRLLLGFDMPENGTVFFDGKDLATLDKRAVRRQLGVVLQNGRLMSGSLYDNIVAGSNLSEEDAWEAARMSGLAEDIEAMPMKMHTVVSEGAGTLSGGQRQRLMIARSIVRRPRVLIFDEATSALDNQTQKTVSDSLANLNCTRVVIAHRLSTIVDADRIFVIDAGNLVEQGSYDELMEQGGVFYKLANRQIT